jgi:hypothetical protein
MRLKTFIEVIFSVLIFSGICFPDETAFISRTGDCRYPAIATEGNNIYLTFLVLEGRPAHLYFRRSSDEGVQWSGSIKISDDKSECLPPAIAVSSGIVHLSWIDVGSTIEGELYYTRSLDGGNTWEKNDILVANANSARFPLITAKGNDVYLIWQDVENKVFFKASHDQGKTWGNELLLGKVGKHSCYCYPPSLAIVGNQLIVIWTDFREDPKGFRISVSGLSLFKSNKDKMISSVVCRRSSDNGRTWSKDQVLTSTGVPKESKDEIDNPTSVTDSSFAYLFWLDKREVPLGEIYFTRYDPGTKKYPLEGKALFSGPKRSPKRPSMVFDDKGNLHLTWASFFQGQSIISYGEIGPAGNILQDQKELKTTIGRHHNPIITRTPSGILYIMWFDEPKEKDRWARIFLKTSKDNGVTWADWEPQIKDMQQ